MVLFPYQHLARSGRRAKRISLAVVIFRVYLQAASDIVKLADAKWYYIKYEYTTMSPLMSFVVIGPDQRRNPASIVSRFLHHWTCINRKCKEDQSRSGYPCTIVLVIVIDTVRACLFSSPRLRTHGRVPRSRLLLPLLLTRTSSITTSTICPTH